MDASLIKKGERYRVEAEVVVVAETGGDANVWVEGLAKGYALTQVDPKHFVSRVERPIGVGDRIKYAGADATVIAIHKDRAWIEYDDGPLGTAMASDLRRIP